MSFPPNSSNEVTLQQLEIIKEILENAKYLADTAFGDAFRLRKQFDRLDPILSEEIFSSLADLQSCFHKMEPIVYSLSARLSGY